MENTKQQLEEVIKSNLPEKKKLRLGLCMEEYRFNLGFNQALSQINTSLIADEVLKVVVENSINIVVNNSSPSNEQMKIVRELRKITL